MDVQCYAQRLLNPFRGAANYIRFESAEAVTLDGVTLDIYVASDVLREGLDSANRVLISDFFSWQAPWLLSLQTSSDEVRAEFEVAAKSLALVVEQQYQLYLHIIDETAIQAARVEAMMRKYQPRDEAKYDTMSTYYIEMGATGGG
jgi:hypothetical protein